jgi:hypothetical protein
MSDGKGEPKPVCLTQKVDRRLEQLVRAESLAQGLPDLASITNPCTRILSANDQFKDGCPPGAHALETR